jgi:NAD(P)-dependent dehydrogenase (short-subunit alcohol dehydrogenase family)
MQLKPIAQQVVVVCGASSGIGRETARQFAARGAKVVVAARSQAGLDSLVDEIHAQGGEALAVITDVTKFDQVKTLAEKAVEAYGRIDSWVHLAAVSIYATFEQTRPEEFKQVIDVNLTGQAYGAMAALPFIKRTGGGALIHVSSVEARRALPFQSAYAASKHGVEGMLEALRMELKHEGLPISVTNIMPASINTPFFNKARTRLGVKPQGVPPFYEPEIVARAICYAAEHPTRDLIVGGVGKLVELGQRISPRLMDYLLSLTSFKMQRSQEPKPADAPNNMFKPIKGYNQVEGDFKNQALQHSTYNTLKQNSVVKGLLATTIVGASAFLTWRALKR